MMQSAMNGARTGIANICPIASIALVMGESLARDRCVRASLEACATSHHWGREALDCGHDVKLIPPIYVKPFVKRSKNDGNDAAAIATAVRRPDMRFVPVKSQEQQGHAMLFRTHQTLTRQRTQLIITPRGHLNEHGIVVAKGNAALLAFEEKIERRLWAMRSADPLRENHIAVKDVISPKDRFGPEAIEHHNGSWQIRATIIEA